MAVSQGDSASGQPAGSGNCPVLRQRVYSAGRIRSLVQKWCSRLGQTPKHPNRKFASVFGSECIRPDSLVYSANARMYSAPVRVYSATGTHICLENIPIAHKCPSTHFSYLLIIPPHPSGDQNQIIACRIPCKTTHELLPKLTCHEGF